MINRNTDVKSFSLKKEIIEKINILADKLYRKKSTIIELAINDYYEKIKKEIALED